MTSPTRNFVLFQTDLFLFHQTDKDIDSWFVGGDCAGWFYARLLPHYSIRPDCNPVMEDWGWIFAVSVDDVRVWVSVWTFYGIENCWLLGLESKKRLFRRQSPETLLRGKDVVCDALENIITADPRFAKHRWYAENPFDVDVKEF